MFGRLIVVGVCFWLALASCAEQGPAEEQASATGELGYFSGRPPPSWTLSAEELADIRGRLEGLGAASEPEAFPRFGPVSYRVGDFVGVSGLPDEIHVQDGIVETRTGSTYAYFTDDKQLEAFLKSSATRAGAYALLKLDDAP